LIELCQFNDIIYHLRETEIEYVNQRGTYPPKLRRKNILVNFYLGDDKAKQVNHIGEIILRNNLLISVSRTLTEIRV